MPNAGQKKTILIIRSHITATRPRTARLVCSCSMIRNPAPQQAGGEVIRITTVLSPRAYRSWGRARAGVDSKNGRQEGWRGERQRMIETRARGRVLLGCPGAEGAGEISDLEEANDDTPAGPG